MRVVSGCPIRPSSNISRKKCPLHAPCSLLLQPPQAPDRRPTGGGRPRRPSRGRGGGPGRGRPRGGVTSCLRPHAVRAKSETALSSVMRTCKASRSRVLELRAARSAVGTSSAVRGRFAHAPAEAAAGHRTRRTKPSTTLPQPTPHRVCKTWLGSRFGRRRRASERILSRHLRAHARPPPSRGPGGKQRCLADVNACRAHVISTLWPQSPRRQNGAAGVEIWCGDSVSRSVLWLGRIACRTHTAARACMCVRVCACVCVCVCVYVRARVCVHGAGGVGRGAHNAAGRQAGRPFQCSHCGGEPSKSSSVSSCSSSSISSSPPSS